MPMNFENSSEMTSRDYTQHEWEVQEFEMQAKHQIQLKQLDIQASKLEAKITSWFRLPLTVITLPVRILFIIPLSIYAAKGKEVPEEFWRFLR